MNQSLRSNNKCGETGICWVKRRNSWLVQLSKNGKNIYSRSFKNKDDAIEARKTAVEKYYGEFAYKD